MCRGKRGMGAEGGEKGKDIEGMKGRGKRENEVFIPSLSL